MDKTPSLLGGVGIMRVEKEVVLETLACHFGSGPVKAREMAVRLRGNRLCWVRTRGP